MTYLEDIEKMTSFLKSCYAFTAKSLHIHFNPSQNVSLILLVESLVTVANEESIACKCLM